MLIHATAVEMAGKAVLIRGRPGTGKSSLALALMESPGSGLAGAPVLARLIADDQTQLSADAGSIWCGCPKELSGLLEVRGIGIINVEPATPAPLRLVVDLVSSGEAPRMPGAEEASVMLLGLALPRLLLDRNGPALASRVRTAFFRP